MFYKNNIITMLNFIDLQKNYFIISLIFLTGKKYMCLYSKLQKTARFLSVILIIASSIFQAVKIPVQM